MTKEAFDRAKVIDAECGGLRRLIDRANDVREHLDDYDLEAVTLVPKKGGGRAAFELCKEDADALLAKIASRAACKVLLLSEEFSRL